VAPLEVIEESLKGNTGSAKHGSAPEDFGVAVNDRKGVGHVLKIHLTVVDA